MGDCESCGSPLGDGAAFCAVCGNPVTGSDAPTAPVTEPSSTPWPSRGQPTEPAPPPPPPAPAVPVVTPTPAPPPAGPAPGQASTVPFAAAVPPTPPVPPAGGVPVGPSPVGPTPAASSTGKTLVIVGAVVAFVLAVGLIALLVLRDGGDTDPAPTPTSEETTEPGSTVPNQGSGSSSTTTSTTAPTTAATTPSTAPTTARPATVADLPPGLFCRDLNAQGWSYPDAVAYWNIEGNPDRMDADLNGIPCETVYPRADVIDYWGQAAPPSGIASLPSGLFCRDLNAQGFSYAEAVAYWFVEGTPDRMDEDLNGIPCETVYPASEVSAYWDG